MSGLGRPAALAGLIIVALMIAGTMPVEVDDAWLWAVLVLFAVAVIAGGSPTGPRKPPRRPERPEE